MKKLVYMCIATIVVIGSGCASIVSGQKQQLTFNSEPADATVTINGAVVGKTPMTFMVDRKSEVSVSFMKDGYKSQSLILSTTLNGWFWGNIVFGGFLGSTTDAASGAMHEYAPNQYFVTLVPNSTAQSIDPLPEKAKVKDFIILNYQNIIQDVNKGSGQYLSSLLVMLKVQNDNQSEAQNKIKALSTVYMLIPDFAEQVVNYFMKDNVNTKT